MSGSSLNRTIPCSVKPKVFILTYVIIPSLANLPAAHDHFFKTTIQRIVSLDVLCGDHDQYSKQPVQRMGFLRKYTLDARHALGFLYQCAGHFRMDLLQGKNDFQQRDLACIISYTG